MSTTRLAAIAAFLMVGCFPVPVPVPDIPVPTPEPVDEPDASSGEPGPCEGLPEEWAGWYTEDDPCCPVHQCLVDAGENACAEFEVCYALRGDAVCGDTICNGEQCSTCEVEP